MRWAMLEQLAESRAWPDRLVIALEQSLAEGKSFSEGIKTAIERGYDPGFISRLMLEGPREAAPILKAIVNDQDNTLRDMVNANESAIDKMNNHIREVSRLTFLATHSTSDQMNADFSGALAILEQNAGVGGRKTAEAIARELGIGVDEVRRIAGEYGITLADGINPVLAAAPDHNGTMPFTPPVGPVPVDAPPASDKKGASSPAKPSSAKSSK